MSVTAAPGATFYPSVEWGITGLTGTIGVRILKDSDGSTALARATAGISEVPATSGNYVATIVSPTTAGEYTILWDNGAVTPGNTATEDLIVTYSAAPAAVPSGTDLCTVADVKQAITKLGADDDALIQTLITQASAVITKTYRRDFAPMGTLTRRVLAPNRIVSLAPYDLRAATSVTMDPAGSPVVLTADQYAFEPFTTSLLGTYTWLQLGNYVSFYSETQTQFNRGVVEITGTWGPTAVPPDVTRAAVITVASWIDRLASDSALTGFDTDGRGIAPDSFQSWAVPFAAHRILSQYARLEFA